MIDQWNAEHPDQKVEYDYEREGGVEFSEADAARVNGVKNEETYNWDNIKPIGQNRFGGIYDQFRGKAREAFYFLKSKKEGYLKGVFHRDDIGDIDLVWGDAPNDYNGKGLAHIIRKHIQKFGDFNDLDDAIATISDVINNGESYNNSRDARLVNIEKGDYRVVAMDNEGNWVLSALDFVTPKKVKLQKKEGKTLPPSRTPGQSNDEAGAVTSNLSTGKDTASNSDVQAESAKTTESGGALFRVRRAPNGEESNLDERQYDEVRTDNFKKWFGDWELGALYKMATDVWGGDKTQRRFNFAPSERAAVRFKELLGHDVTKLVNTSDAIRHIKKHHGNDESRGQISMTAEDIVLLPYLIDNYDTMSLAPEYNDKLGNRAIEIRKRVNGTTVIATIERGKANEHIVTSWKFKKSDALDAQSTPGLHVRNDSDFAKIKQEIETIKESAKNSSKIVDENGEPLVVWHGTDNDFFTFDRGRLGENTDFNADEIVGQTAHIGFWFNRGGEEMLDMTYGKRMPVYLDIKEPIEFTSLRALSDEIAMRGGAERFVDDMRDAGHDGVVVKDEEFGGTSYVAFEPTQIKSATENNGEFSSENGDIRFRERDEHETGGRVREKEEKGYRSLFDGMDDREEQSRPSIERERVGLKEQLAQSSDDDLLREIGESSAEDRTFYSEEYDRRHLKEYNEMCDNYRKMLDDGKVEFEQAEEMLLDAIHDWREGHASAERTRLLAQFDTLNAYYAEKQEEAWEREDAEYDGPVESATSPRNGEQVPLPTAPTPTFDPTAIGLRQLTDGETSYVQRRYERSGQFDFTGSERIESADDVAYIFRNLENSAIENVFLVLVKDGRGTILHVGMGDYRTSLGHLGAGYLAASELRPDKVVMVHNHPSGSLEPSGADLELHNKVVRMFGDDVVAPSIIIDTTRGEYSEFEAMADLEIKSRKRSSVGEIPYDTYTFSRQVFAPGYNPATAFTVRSSEDVAKFVSSHRLGERPKVSLIVLDNRNHVVGNAFLPYTELKAADASRVSDETARYVHQMGGNRAILYGRVGSVDGAAVKSIKSALRDRDVSLVDFIDVNRGSYNDRGMLNEAGARYAGSVSEGDINDAISRAKRDAERMPDPIEFTKENWDKAFPAGKVTTPIGEVSLGAHQFEKMQSKGRTAEVGLMKATLERPDFVIEENAQNESAERQSNYLFVKTFVKDDGTTYRHYESVTISRDGGEVVVSSHYISENKLRSVLKDGNLIYKKEDSQSSNGSEMRLAETQSGRSDLLPTPDDNESYSGKVSENSADGQMDGGETTNFRVRDGHEAAVEEARRRLESDDASEFERTAARTVIKAYGGGSGDAPDTPDGGGVRFRTRDDADMLVDMAKHNNEVARQRRDAVTDFVKAITDVDELTDSKFATALGKVMRGQRQYDQATVADITTMVKAMMDAGLLTELDNFSVKQILTKVKDSTGKNDITAEANKLIDIMLKHQLRRGKRAFEQQLKVKGMRQDSRGVVVQKIKDY